MRELTSKTGARLFVFDSQSEAVNYCDGKLFPERDDKFVGRKLPNWGAAHKAANELWSEGVEILLEFVTRLGNLKIELKDRRRKTQFTEDDGDEFDMDRARSGQTPWRKSVREEIHGAQECTVLMDVTTPASRDSDDILWRGAAAIALTQILESRGYRVELWAVMGSYLFQGKDYPVCTCINLKKTSDPLDLSTLVNTVSGWYYRSVDFTLFETLCKRHGERKAYGFGGCYTPRPQDLDEISRDPNRVYSAHMFSFSGAEQLIRAEVEKIAQNATPKESQ